MKDDKKPERKLPDDEDGSGWQFTAAGELATAADKDLPMLDAVDWRIPGRLMDAVARIIGDDKPDIEAAVKKAFDEDHGVKADEIVKTVRAARAAELPK